MPREHRQFELIVSEFMPLNGVIQAPGGADEDRDGGFEHGGWTSPHWHDDIGKALVAPAHLSAHARRGQAPRACRLSPRVHAHVRHAVPDRRRGASLCPLSEPPNPASQIGQTHTMFKCMHEGRHADRTQLAARDQRLAAVHAKPTAIASSDLRRCSPAYPAHRMLEQGRHRQAQNGSSRSTMMIAPSRRTAKSSAVNRSGP